MDLTLLTSLTSLTLTDVLTLAGGAYAGLSLAAVVLPPEWKITQTCARLSADLRNVIARNTTKKASAEKATVPVLAPKRVEKRDNGVPNVLLFAALSLALGCHHSPSKVNWPAIAECSPEPESIIGAVSETLLNGGSWRQALEDLARVHGTTVVTCAVERLRSDWSAHGAAASPERVDGLARADEFLAGKQIRR